MDLYSIVALAGLMFLVVFSIRFYFAIHPSKGFNPVKFMARVGIFSSMAAILYVIDIFTIKLPIFPSFLSFHFDEIPALICGFAYGPISGFAVIVIKTLIKLPFTSTATVGEWGDLLLSCLFVLPACFIYKKKRNLKGVAIGFGISSIFQLIGAMLLNVYVFIPFYSWFYGLSYETLLYICQAANPAITNVGWSYALFAVLPFNVIKNFAVIILTFIIYRSIHKLLHFEKDESI